MRVDDAAIDDRRIAARGFQQRADHRGRRSLAVVPAIAIPTISRRIKLAQHLGAAHDGEAAFAAVACTSGIVQGFTADEMTTTRASPRFSALWPMAILIPSACKRRTLAPSATSLPWNLAGEVAQDLGNAARADAADADKVESSPISEQPRLLMRHAPAPTPPLAPAH